MQVELIKRFQFEAAHARGGRLHGHSYLVELRCAGACDEHLGWLVDYGDISNWFDPLYRQLDHRLLDDVDGLRDTSLQGIEAWLTARLHLDLPSFESVRVAIVGDCTFQPRRIDDPGLFNDAPRLRFGFEAAHFLPNVPEAHKCRRMHGHSFRVEVAADDLTTLEPALRQLYDELDRRCLNEIDGLHNATSEQISRWIWNRLSENGRSLVSVTVAETCTARCIYRGITEKGTA